MTRQMVGWLGALLIVLGPSFAQAAPKRRALPDDEFETDTSGVTKAARKQMNAVRACYVDVLKKVPGLKGKIVVRFKVATSGAAREVTIDQDTMGNEEVASCIVGVVETWTFPAELASDEFVSFPFVFSPGG